MEKATVDGEWLINAVAHALRNPIFAALLQAELLAARTVEPAAHKVYDHLRRLESTIEEMLLYGRPAEVEAHPTHIEPVLRLVAESFAEGNRGETAQIEIEVEPKGCRALADSDALRIILERIIENAAQHTPSPHVVRVHAAAGDEGVEIVVSDEGEGIAEEIQKKLFLPFFPQHKGRAGLGLAIAAKFAAAIGATLMVTSAPGSGTRVTVRLAPADS